MITSAPERSTSTAGRHRLRRALATVAVTATAVVGGVTVAAPAQAQPTEATATHSLAQPGLANRTRTIFGGSFRTRFACEREAQRHRRMGHHAICRHERGRYILIIIIIVR